MEKPGRRPSVKFVGIAILAAVGFGLATVFYFRNPAPLNLPSPLQPTTVQSMPTSISIPSSAEVAPSSPPTQTFQDILREKGIVLQLGEKVKALVFSPDGMRFAAGRFEGLGGVTVWDMATGNEVFNGWKGQVIHALTFSADKRFLAASGVGDIHLWSFEDERGISVSTQGSLSPVCSLAFTPDGKTLAAALRPDRQPDGSCILLYDVPTGQIRRLRGQTGWVWSLAISPDGQRIASGAEDGTVVIWDLPTGEPHRTLQGHMNVASLAFSPTGQDLCIAGSVGYRILDPTTGALKEAVRSTEGPLWCVAFSPDGSRLATGGRRALIRDTATKMVLHTFSDHSDAIWGIAFSPGGDVLATASWDKTVRLQHLAFLSDSR